MKSNFRQKAHRLRVDAHIVWLAARDSRTPLLARLIAILVAGYALSPVDLIPDFVPVLGLVDDALLLPLGLWVAYRMIPAPVLQDYRAEAERETERPVSWTGAIVIGCIWLVLLAIFVFYVWSWRYW